MKTIITTLTLLIFSLNSFSQVIEKGNILVNAGVGFGVYGTKSNIDNSNGSAVPGLLNISAGYAITEDISAGVRFERNGFITEDSVKITSMNPAIYVTYNITNSDLGAFYVTGEFGLSKLKFVGEGEYAEKYNVQVYSKKGNKINFDIGYNSYISDNVGLFFQAGYAMYSYQKLAYYNEENEPNEVVWEEVNGTAIKLTMSGINIRTGLTLKF